MTSAERSKIYRQKAKEDNNRHEELKKKDALRKRMYREKLRLKADENSEFQAKLKEKKREQMQKYRHSEEESRTKGEISSRNMPRKWKGSVRQNS